MESSVRQTQNNIRSAIESRMFHRCQLSTGSLDVESYRRRLVTRFSKADSVSRSRALSMDSFLPATDLATHFLNVLGYFPLGWSSVSCTKAGFIVTSFSADSRVVGSDEKEIKRERVGVGRCWCAWRGLGCTSYQ